MQAKTSLDGRRVLITEDELIVAMDLKATISAAGADVVGAVQTLESAYELLETQEIHIAVLDVNLNGRNVFPLARKLRERGIPFLFLTGYNAANILPEEFSSELCLEKPCAETVLIQTLFQLFAIAAIPDDHLNDGANGSQRDLS